MLTPRVYQKFTFFIKNMTKEDSFDSAIALTLKKAREIMVNGYGQEVLPRLKLIGQESILLFDPAPKMVRIIGTLQFAGPDEDEEV